MISFHSLRARTRQFLFMEMSLHHMTSALSHHPAFKEVGMRIVKGRPIQYIRCHDWGLFLRKDERQANFHHFYS